MQRSCKECTHLWREYADAATAHAGIQSKLDIAAFSYDAEAIIMLAPRLRQAAMDRAEARAGIRSDEGKAHSSAGAVAAG
jgi:hypothetical protein